MDASPPSPGTRAHSGMFPCFLGGRLCRFVFMRGIPKANAYTVTMYIMAGLLLVGFTCNVFVRAVAERFFEAESPTLMGSAIAGGSA